MKRLKIWIFTACVLAVAAASVFGTMAYLTSQATVVNTFTVGQVNLILDETKVTPDGKPVDGAARVKENRYHLIPGMTYVKDPTLTVVKGSEEAYVRMLVTVDHIDALEAIFGDPFLPQYFVEGWDETVWLTTRVMKRDEAANTATYEFRYFETVKPAANQNCVLDALFDSITVPASMTGEDLAKITGLRITVVGHAIQAGGFADAEAAWAAFDAEIGG